MNQLITQLQTAAMIEVQQRHELAELFGYETRNKYEIRDESGHPIGFAAEQNKGILQFLIRQFLGHWRQFEVIFFDLNKQPILKLKNRFRWIFQRIEISDPAGSFIGALEQRFALYKRFDVENSRGQVVLEMRSPLWKIWTFNFFRNGQIVARIEKKWSGLLSEAFTDKDKFHIHFQGNLSIEERQLLLAASVFVDLNYFEKKAR